MKILAKFYKKLRSTTSNLYKVFIIPQNWVLNHAFIQRNSTNGKFRSLLYSGITNNNIDQCEDEADRYLKEIEK